MQSALRSAHLAPSSNNLQPWEFHWVRSGSADREAAVTACLSQPAAATSAELVFFVGRPDLLEARCAAMVAHFEAAGNEGTASYYRDQVAANIAGMSAETRNAWVDKSVALAAAQFMLAIKAAGFDSCPMEGLDPDQVRALFSLPKNATVTMAISVGEGTPEGLYGPRLLPALQPPPRALTSVLQTADGSSWFLKVWWRLIRDSPLESERNMALPSFEGRVVDDQNQTSLPRLVAWP